MYFVLSIDQPVKYYRRVLKGTFKAKAFHALYVAELFILRRDECVEEIVC